jgi:NADH dehydrogenase FAD-containing subunit
VEYLQGWADDVNFLDKFVTVEPSVLDPDVGRALTGPRELNSERTTDMLERTLHAGGTGRTQVPTFPVHYDKLIIAVGCYSQTFNTKGVRENAMFLKDVRDAQAIRRRILELFELARLPIIPEETKRYLLHFAIVGGGPTGMEFAACLSDLIRDDISRLHPELLKYIQITLYDVAPKVLPMFDASLADYAVKQYKRQNVQIKTSHQVEELRKGFPNDPDAAQNQDKQVKGRVYTIRTKQEGDVGIGMCVWSTGNMNNPFVAKALNHVRRFPVRSAHITQGGATAVENPNTRQWIIERDARSGVILVDDHFRVNLTTDAKIDEEVNGDPDHSHDPQPHAYVKDVFAIGDTTKLKSGALPATAQVANQQALWLAKALNKFPDPDAYAKNKGFTFRNLGVFTYIGGAKAVLQGPPPAERSGNGGAGGKKATGLNFRGWIAFLLWRGAYLTMTLSWRNKFLVPMQWVAVRLFGRDVSRF